MVDIHANFKSLSFSVKAVGGRGVGFGEFEDFCITNSSHYSNAVWLLAVDKTLVYGRGHSNAIFSSAYVMCQVLMVGNIAAISGSAIWQLVATALKLPVSGKLSTFSS